MTFIVILKAYLIAFSVFLITLRQSLIIFDGNPVIFLTRPISAVFLIASLLLLLTNVVPWIKEKKKLLREED